MTRTACLLISFCAAACASAAAAQDGSQPQLTARELFFAASEPAPAAKAPPKAATKAQLKTGTAKQPAATPSTRVTDSQPSAPSRTETTPLPEGGRLVLAGATAPSTAPAPASGTSLGLKYTILRRSGSDMVEVPPDTIFHAGDGIQFSLQTNGPGYLYIVSQGSSGAWKPMFPTPEVADGDNRVDGWHTYAMPPGSRMVFDEQTGIEKIFIVFSREPETDLENLVYSLRSKKPSPAAAPKEEQAKPKQLLQVASLDIDDATVGRLRNLYARDLIVERVDDKTPSDKTPADKRENAVYVVNPSGSPDSRVVADLRLVHQ
jgi:hypothetical protein